jgi:lysophospholipase L1-like esterase
MKQGFAFSLILGIYLATAQHLLAQDAAVADKPAGPAAAYDENSAGVGPILTTPASIKFWLARRAHFDRQKIKQQHALVFLGDSITEGWGDNFRGMFPQLKLANRGISGDTTRGLLARIDTDVLALKPRGIVLLIGVNDVGLKVPPEGIADNVKLLLAKIAAYDAKIPIILCQVMATSPKQGRPTELIRKLNRLLAEVARGNEQVIVLDTYTLFANPEGEAKPEEFPDLVHPNDAGYAKWRAALWPVMATLGFVEKEADAFTPEPGFEALFDGHDLSGWGFPKTSDAELANLKKRRPGDKKLPAYPIVDAPVTFDGKTASSDGRFRAIGGRLVVTTPTEGRRIQQLATTRDFPGDFTLKLDFRATPNADSGVFVRGRQIQCRDYLLAGPYKDLKKYRPQDWNELVITVKDNKARCRCNGELLEAAFELPATGSIGVEGDRGQMEYRHIRIHRD